MIGRREYDIGGQRFWQTELSCGQIEHLVKVLPADTLFKVTPDSLQQLIVNLGAMLYVAMAVVLIRDGESREDLLDRLDKQGEIEQQAKFFRAHASGPVVAEVVRDFFGFNPLSVLLTALAESATPEGRTSAA